MAIQTALFAKCKGQNKHVQEVVTKGHCSYHQPSSCNSKLFEYYDNSIYSSINSPHQLP